MLLSQVKYSDLFGRQDPDDEIENSVKKHGKGRIPDFCHIQVIVFDLSYLPVAAVGTQQVRYHAKNVKTVFSIFNIFFMVAYLLVDSLGQKLQLECNRSSGFGIQKCFSRNFQLQRRDPKVKLQSLENLDANNFSEYERNSF